MLNGEADRRESCCLLELSLRNKQQLQLESELASDMGRDSHYDLLKI